MAGKNATNILRLAIGASGGSKPLKSAAIRWKGQVYEGGSHPEVLDRMIQEGIDVDVDAADYGFVTSGDKFVTRDEASWMVGNPDPLESATAREGGHLGIRAGQVLSPKRTPAGLGANLLQELGQIGTYFKKNPSAISQMMLGPQGSAAVDIARQKLQEPGAGEFRTAMMSMTGAGMVENNTGWAKAASAATKTGTDLMKLALGAETMGGTAQNMRGNAQNLVEGIGQAFYENPLSSALMTTPLASAVANAGVRQVLAAGGENRAIMPLGHQQNLDLVKAAILDQPITPDLISGGERRRGTVYHGTTHPDAVKILQEGVKIEEHAGRNWNDMFGGGFHGPGFYTTTDPKSAVTWAMSGAEHHRTKLDPDHTRDLPQLDVLRGRVDQGKVLAFEDLMSLFNVRADQDFDEVLHKGGFDLPLDQRVGSRTGANLSLQTTREIANSLGQPNTAARNAAKMFPGIEGVSFPWINSHERHVVFTNPSGLDDLRSLYEVTRRQKRKEIPSTPVRNSLYYLE